MGKCREKVKPGRKVDLKELFWFGFLFVGGNKTTIRKLIENQLINPVLPKNCKGERCRVEKEAAETVTKLIESNDEIELYGHYCEDSDDIRDIPIDLKVKTIKDLHKELIESEKLEKKKKHK